VRAVGPSGLFDLSGTPSVRQSTFSTPVLPHDWLIAFFDIALPGIDQEGRRSPAVSPLYADLTGLPPALFTVGALDPLVDESSTPEETPEIALTRPCA
jgi:acetyl esterase